MIHLKTSLATLGKISGTKGRRTNCHSCFQPENGSYTLSLDLETVMVNETRIAFSRL